MKSYTYLAIHKTTGYFYYGVRLTNKVQAVEDIGILYFTSSSTVKSIVQAEGTDAFTWIVRKEFENKEDANRWEYKVIRRMLTHPKILNRALSPKNVPGNWFTGGTVNILGKYCPIGYQPGRTYHETNFHILKYEKQKSRRWWNNGVVELHSDVCPSKQWERGRIPKSVCNFNGKHISGKLWWNNGIEHYRGERPPAGFTRGRIPHTIKKQRRKRSPEGNKKCSDALKLKRWWTNGTLTVFSEHPPTGFTSGAWQSKSQLNRHFSFDCWMRLILY